MWFQVELQEHPVFASVNWDDLLARKVKPPFIPKVVRLIQIQGGRLLIFLISSSLTRMYLFLNTPDWSLWYQLHWPCVHAAACPRLSEWVVPAGWGQRGLSWILLHEPGGVHGSAARFITTLNLLGACLLKYLFFLYHKLLNLSLFLNTWAKNSDANTAMYCMFYWLHFTQCYFYYFSVILIIFVIS